MSWVRRPWKGTARSESWWFRLDRCHIGGKTRSKCREECSIGWSRRTESCLVRCDRTCEPTFRSTSRWVDIRMKLALFWVHSYRLFHCCLGRIHGNIPANLWRISTKHRNLFQFKSYILTSWFVGKWQSIVVLTLKVDSSRVLLVKHAYHQAHGFFVERCPRTIAQCCLQFIGTNEPRSVSINSKSGQKLVY